MRVFIGFDPREPRAYQVAAGTLMRQAGIIPIALMESRLRSVGLFTRPVSGGDGEPYYDVISRVHQSTQFSVSRFLVPIIAHGGWALFTDCDVVFLEDVRRMLDEIDDDKAVYVVKHRHVGSQSMKMDDQQQREYARKNWSSVMLFNCSHPGNARLSLRDVNERHRDELHAFYWLHDDEIGELDPRWNWLVDVHAKPDKVAIAHYTLGGPFLPTWQGGPHDDLWLNAERSI